jgi:exodeoxyribonuclease VII large subunit
MPPEVASVWQVVRYLKERIESDARLTDIWIGGEISNLTLASSGHIYFTLKDQGGSLRCVFFRQRNIGQRERVEAGASLIVHGSVSVFERRGELQLIVDFVQPAGTGALQAEYERRKARFEEEGLFAPERKRPLPRFPRRIGLVTSAQGAAYHDVQTVLERRWPLAELIFQAAPVQGDEAPVAIAEGIKRIAAPDAPHPRPEVLIVGRGGGSTEDLWAFNEEPVVRAVFGCPVPVISAVGHETDTSLSDLAADVRAPTPSAAAELVAPDRAVVMRRIQEMRLQHDVQLTRSVAAARESVDGRLDALRRALPDVEVSRRQIAQYVDSMQRSVLAVTAGARESASALAHRLEGLSPVATLERGYALVSRPDGSAVAAAAEVSSGDAITVRWRDGTRAARVESDR